MDHDARPGRPPLSPGLRLLIVLASLFAAYAFYRAAVEGLGWAPFSAVGAAVVGFLVFAVVQDFWAPANIVGFPALSYLTEAFGTFGFWLGAIALALYMVGRLARGRAEGL